MKRIRVDSKSEEKGKPDSGYFPSEKMDHQRKKNTENEQKNIQTVE